MKIIKTNDSFSFAGHHDELAVFKEYTRKLQVKAILKDRERIAKELSAVSFNGNVAAKFLDIINNVKAHEENKNK
jgi:hypothetical protein